MIGHIVGTGVQIVVDAGCRLIICDNPGCTMLGYIVHEAMVEPFVDGLIYGTGSEYFGSNQTWSVFSGDFGARIVGSIIASKIGETIYDAYLPTAPLSKVVLESVTGLLGAMGASKLYELIDEY